MKKLGSILAFAVMLFGLTLVGAGEASAASNGTHYQSYSCNGLTAKVFYEVDGIGSATINSAYITSVDWTSSPAAQYDRLSFYALNSYPDGDDQKFYEYGGSASTQNDVPSSHNSAALSRLYTWANGDTGRFSLNVWGGPGNSDAYCQVNHDLL